ncbi:MAG: hypothetical protein A2Z48_09550 [Actinobacteria bacterium RBG_19FT_COMBO_70_19]|nr:MAG: hypothetical protein A2Z48_09550 [Actinobacteria bacterium RBG_19FT_COMBO_70_19]
MPLGLGASTGNISSARRALLASAFCCDSSANPSCSSREIPYMSTRFSAVSPMRTPESGSSSPSLYIASYAVASPRR